MHFSAKRGIAIACRLSVCPSVGNVGGSGAHRLGWKAWKLITRTISPTRSTPSLLVAQRHPPRPGGTWGNLEETRSGAGKVVCGSIKVAVSLKRVKVQEKLLWRGYRNSQTLFQTAPSPTLYGLTFTRLGVRNPIQNCNRHYLRNG